MRRTPIVAHPHKVLRLRVACDPLVIWRWGGWFSLLLGLALGGTLTATLITGNEMGWITLREPSQLLFWFLVPTLVLAFTYQRAEFDNVEMIVRITYGIVFPVWHENIPYASIRGVGTDYPTVRIMPSPPSMRFHLFLYTKSRRTYWLSSHYLESDYRRAVERIVHHASFPILRWE